MLYIHQFPGWNDFRFDSRKVLNALGETRFQEGSLLGIMQMHNLKDLSQELLVKDIIANYAIDGYKLDSSKIAEQISLHKNTNQSMIKNYLGAILNSANPITHERLFAWHASMGQNKVASYRKTSSKIDSLIGEKKFFFEGPNADRLTLEMENFIYWIENTQMDGVIKAAIAHFWFITIRPFDDANGRLARLLSILVLARSENTTKCQYALNQQILEKKDEYFKILNKTQSGNGDLTEWILWFLKTMQESFKFTEKIIENKNQKLSFFNKHTGEAFNQKEQTLLNAIFEKKIPNSFTVKEIAILENTSHDTALRTIQALINRKILKAEKKGGRSQRYSLL